MFPRILLVSFLSFLQIFCLSQPPSAPLESPARINALLKQLAQHNSRDVQRVNLLNELAEMTGIRDKEKTGAWAIEAKGLAEQLKYKTGMAKSAMILAELRLNQAQYDEGISYFNEAIAIYKQELQSLDLGICYHGLAMLYNNINRNKASTEYFLKALDIFNGLGEYRRAGAVHNNLGRMFQVIGNKEKALEHYRQALLIAEEHRFYDMLITTQNNISSFYTDKKEFVQAEQVLLRILHDTASRKIEPQIFQSLAITYGKMDRFEEAINYYHKVLDHPLTKRPSPQEMMTHGNMATLYLQSGNLDKAEEFALKAIAFAETTRQPHITSFQQIRLADIYAAQKKTQQAIAIYEEAFPRLNYAQTDPFTVEKMYRNLVGLYEQNRDSAGMFRAHLRLARFRDSITSADVKKQVASLHIQYETEKKEQQIDLLNKDKLLQQALFDQQQLAFLAERKENDLTLLQTSNDLQKAKLNEQAALLAAEQGANELATITSQKEIAEKETLIQSSQLKEQQVVSYSMIILSVLLLVVGALLLSRYRLKQKANTQLNRKNEKIELLMRELHHRVKNNMQLISSLLSLQSLRMPDSEAKTAVQEGQQRVEAMGLIHKELYLHDDSTRVHVKKYLTNLVDNLVQSHHAGAAKIDLQTSIADISLDVDTAVPLGLIVNELVTNSMKYALGGHASPALFLSLELVKPTQLVFRIRDNGPGILASASPDSFGLRMVQTLTRQLAGTIVSESNNGTQHTLTIPIQP